MVQVIGLAPFVNENCVMCYNCEVSLSNQFGKDRWSRTPKRCEP